MANFWLRDDSGLHRNGDVVSNFSSVSGSYHFNLVGRSSLYTMMHLNSGSDNCQILPISCQGMEQDTAGLSARVSLCQVCPRSMLWFGESIIILKIMSFKFYPRMRTFGLFFQYGMSSCFFHCIEFAKKWKAGIRFKRPIFNFTNQYSMQFWDFLIPFLQYPRPIIILF